MKKITHVSIGKILGISSSAVTQRINNGKGFYISEAQKLSKHFNTPIEAWVDIKAFISNHKHSMPDTTVHHQEETQNQLHQKESA